MIEHDLRPPPQPPVTSSPGSIGAALPATLPEPQAYHRAARVLWHRRYWWRPLVTLVVTAAVFVVMNFQVMVPLLIAGEIWPAAATSSSLTDPLNPADQFLGLGMLALLVPAVLVGTLAGYGRAGIALSVLGRFRWGLLGRAALVVVPVFVLLNLVLNLILEREAIVVPQLSAGVVLAWLLALVLSPLQCAGEEFAFRALPMQMLGTWLRRPVLGILLPVPLFVLGHGYSWMGQIDIALFAIVMGLLAWKTGGLEIPILVHTANNWTLFAIAPLIPGFTEQGEVELLGLLLALIPMLLLSAGIWWWYSRRAGLGLWEPQRGRGVPLADR
ncbi:CPBP family intramembrane metalloprotease domain-containing protein [Brachybacterium avium]|uniref:CPBP family intramembrane metalloprotease domain-containing protein n=1 Tax=Brachybacterium avium TaxID=2017485 RepID=A0A220UDG1_9MICO|nr:type II CAAX endopeptidase family protein [Brachybacterium avium]ASK65991.1 CPBP family intramembrane metalloprotease domain-containing protein [Brachybacterium avium]